MSRTRNHRRNPRGTTGLNEAQPFRSGAPSDLAVSLTNHSGGSSSRRAGAAPRPSETQREGRHEAAAGKRRSRGAYAGQESSDANKMAGKAEDRRSTTGRGLGSGSGSGSGSSSSGRVGSVGMSLTEENVKRTARYFEDMRRDNAGERGESSGRRASLLATLEEAGSKLSGGRR
ncbi:predicted protein [Chaetomium globosum CBS 148.51]|uniref:Uncharacterized protein n=1 Tax=Chaetomium globosum (strain ATCC 6205 / CBS 148.51 / DSM 1962 / NBRC 6347 / NRRL 1970) TaxID=306901 RepID=Q2HEY9_CHAGB|nr:uncharacterized protein CHGG_01215 [Chaetomium globosum CBS 148.51]EAQ92980.1 predicted protein [Chaetomium globosum CBS 148.51]